MTTMKVGIASLAKMENDASAGLFDPTADIDLHLNNRTENFQLADDLVAAKKISQDQANIMKEFAAINSARDVMRSIRRMRRANAAMGGITVTQELIEK